RQALEEYGRLRAELGPIHRRIEELRARAETSRLSPAEREGLQGDLARLRRIGAESEEQGLTILEALKRAARDDPENPDVRAAFAMLYLEKWREAHAAGDRVAEELYRSKVVEFDGKGAFREEIEGGGTLEIVGAPQGAEAFLFRYEPQAAVRAGGESRLVPVPFHPARGLLHGAEGEGAREEPSSPGPGSVVLRVERVAPGSAAERAGIRPEELVLSVAGVEVEEAVFAVHPEPHGPAAQAGIRPFDRIARIAGQRVQGENTLEQAYEDLPAGEGFKAVFQRGGAELRVAATKSGAGLSADLGTSLRPAEEALRSDPFPENLVEVCWWSQGRIRKASFAGPEPIGLRLARTAYPLLLAPENSVGFLPVSPLRAPPGSY
ncbi:MAG: PDZ domain-containing protein, partial [Planctomycetota bacterium]